MAKKTTAANRKLDAAAVKAEDVERAAEALRATEEASRAAVPKRGWFNWLLG